MGGLKDKPVGFKAFTEERGGLTATLGKGQTLYLIDIPQRGFSAAKIHGNTKSSAFEMWTDNQGRFQVTANKSAEKGAITNLKFTLPVPDAQTKAQIISVKFLFEG